MSRLATWWNSYWFTPASPYPLAAFRILFAVYLFVYFLSFAPWVELLFSSRGVYAPFLIRDLAPAPRFAWAVHVAALCAIAGLVIGLATRLSTFVVLAIYVHYYFLQFGSTNYSYDRLNLIFLAVLLLAEPAAVWSWDSRHREPQSPSDISAWAQRLLRFQIVAMYFGSGLFKLLNPLWRDGMLMRMTFAGSWGTGLSFWITGMGLPGYVFDALTWGVIGFELALGFGLLHPRLRSWAMMAGVSFHLANWMLLGIPEFMSCVASYVLFLPGPTVQRYGDRLSSMVLPREQEQAAGPGGSIERS